MMEEMRSTVLASFAILVVSGCAHTSETRESSTTVVTAPPATRQVIAVDEQPPQEEAPRARPRITQTITLGQGNGESTYSATPAPAAPQGQQSVTNNVTVNNVIVNQPPVYGGYGAHGSYGYGASAGRGGYGVRTDGFGRGASGGGQWGSSGWEGARRTAAPGATPGVGGNWAPARSYGPSQMK